MSPPTVLTRSTSILFGAIGGTTAATKSVYIPACSLHLSSVIYRETIVEKAKHVVEAANKKVGETLGNVIEGAEHVAEAATHKTEELKRHASEKSEHLKDSASNVKQELDKKVNQGVRDAEDAASQKAEELEKQAYDATEKVRKEFLSEKTIIDTVKDGVDTIEHLVEKTKESFGLGLHQAEHKVDELKDEIKLGAKKAANYAQETKDKAAKEDKDKLN
jgi:hypothetical protein